MTTTLNQVLDSSNHYFTISYGNDARYVCHEDDTLLMAALRAGVGISYECNAGGCGSCKVTVKQGEVIDLMPNALGIKPKDRSRGKVLACQCRAKADCVIEFNLDANPIPFLPTKYRAILTHKKMITHDLCEFTFKLDRKMTFLPGQYALISLPNMDGCRSYSMSNVAGDNHSIQFIIRHTNGKATTLLFDEIDLGEIFQIDGPYGNAFYKPSDAKNIICIGGGSGLAPMLSVLQGALADEQVRNEDIHFYYGTRSLKDLFENKMFPYLLPDNNLNLVKAISEKKESCEIEHNSIRIGYIHEHVEQDLNNVFLDAEFYIAGPPPMVDAVRKMLIVKYQVPIERLHYDRLF